VRDQAVETAHEGGPSAFVEELKRMRIKSSLGTELMVSQLYLRSEALESVLGSELPSEAASAEEMSLDDTLRRRYHTEDLQNQECVDALGITRGLTCEAAVKRLAQLSAADSRDLDLCVRIYARPSTPRCSRWFYARPPSARPWNP
jgi:hypothetical protein